MNGGIRIWGARTLSSDPSWRYINVRRLFIMVESSIERATQWVVFEPNDHRLWKRVQRTILEEAWRPTFARLLVPRYTALRRDLQQYLRYYNFERAHTGRRNQGQPPADIVYAAQKMHPR